MKARAVLRVGTAWLLLAAMAPVVPAQTPPLDQPPPTQPPTPRRRPPIFEAGIEIIQLAVSVMDAHNRYITGLREADFAVFEDGVRQDLTLFNHDDIPISLALMLDTSASMDEKLKELKVTVRCVPLDTDDEPGKCIFTGQPSTRRGVFAKSY